MGGAVVADAVVVPLYTIQGNAITLGAAATAVWANAVHPNRAALQAELQRRAGILAASLSQPSAHVLSASAVVLVTVAATAVPSNAVIATKV